MYYFHNGKRKSDARGNGDPAEIRNGIFGQMACKARDDHNSLAMEGPAR
jgi:hypothetical protein